MSVSQNIKTNLSAVYLFLTPALSAIFVFFFIPVITAFVLSFTDFDIYALGSIWNTRFIGFDNYLKLFNDPLFWKALKNTFFLCYICGTFISDCIAGSCNYVELKVN